ncbi:MAG: FemAB family XrtA/PEP-CTERM system-associated protein [Granulosicoccus sp.]
MARQDKQQQSLRGALKRSPASVLAAWRAGETEPGKLQQLELLGDALVRQLATITDSDDSFNRLRREIGAAKSANQDTAPLIADMKILSAKRKENAAGVDTSIDALLQLMAAADSGGDTFPAHFSDSSNSGQTDGIAGASHTDVSLSTGLAEEFTSSGDSVASAAAAVTIRSDFDAAEWDRYVSQHTAASAYHDSRWKALIEQVFGHNCHYLAAQNAQGAIVGVLPLVHLKSRLFGSFIISMPYFNYGGPLANSPAIANTLMSASDQLAEQLGCSHAEIRECQERTDRQHRSHKVSMLLPLPESNDALDKALGAKLRSQIRASERHNPAINFGREELLADFYNVFSRNMRDLGTPVYSRAFFLAILKQFPESTFLAVVRINGKPAAAAFLFGYRDTLEIPWASTLRSANQFGANMYLYRQILGEAQRRGFKFFDFGRSTENGPTYKFKKQWGARPHQLHWHYWTPAGESIPSLDPGNPKYRLVIGVWQKLPVPLTRLIGPPIVRYLP